MSGEQITSELCVQSAVIQELGPGPISQGGGVDDEDSLASLAYVLLHDRAGARVFLRRATPSSIRMPWWSLSMRVARQSPSRWKVGRCTPVWPSPRASSDVGVVALLSLERPCCWRSRRFVCAAPESSPTARTIASVAAAAAGAMARGDGRAVAPCLLAPFAAAWLLSCSWLSLSEVSSPGGAGEAAALPLATQEFVANGVGRPSRSAPECCIAGADG